MDFKRAIRVSGAREHNLKNISVDIPKEAITVITGPSGSGKSTLAMDIIYAEGQRRYLESLSSYARQFLGMPQKPDVDRIEGLCPSIAIDQKTVGNNPRSTVGTITEIYDYLRVLFARVGQLHCPICDALIQAASSETIAERLFQKFKGTFVTIAAPIVVDKKGEFTKELEVLFTTGYYRFVVDGRRYSFRNIEEIKALKLSKKHRHSIDILIDALEVREEDRTRLHEALDQAFARAQGMCKVIAGTQELLFSSERMCVTCAQSFPEIEPRLFSFNSPLGACTECHGIGMVVVFGIFSKAQAEKMGGEVGDYWREMPCATCEGKRLSPLALAVRVGEKNIDAFCRMSVSDLIMFMGRIPMTEKEHMISDRLVKEIRSRLTFLDDVGLGYLSLGRTARTLSGGESQRIRLATQIGSALSGVVYVLDEPSIGLHQRDTDRLIKTLKKLRDHNNTVIVVEHDIDTMLNADYLIDMGPAAGRFGGSVVAYGTPDQVTKNKASLTGDYLSGRRAVIPPMKIRTPCGMITLNDVHKNNLKNLTVQFPLGVLCGISGVSGSGKSTLILEELVPALKSVIGRRGSYEVSKITGVKDVDYLIVIDQTPIGRTPRSNPATYLGIFDDIRKLFASLPDSQARGYTVGRFSFNVKEGRCSECSGEGSITVSMHFLPDVTMLCTRCKGLRYNAQTLEITYKGKNIADVLDMTAAEAYEFFAAHTPLARRLKLLCDVGLDYIKMGQSSLTLSGGEAQRIKLVEELAKRGGRTIYVLDEPTTGLHPHDVERLLKVLNTLVDKGNTLIVIEHNIDVLKCADHVIDLGPEGGDAGGMIVAQGAPREVARAAASHTGKYLAAAFGIKL